MSTPRFIKLLLKRSLWGSSDFRLVDVGASGGIASKWAAFGERLWAVGFEPLVAEAERLSANERRPKVHYEAAFVGWSGLSDAFTEADRHDPVKNRYIQSFNRSSAVRAHELMRQDYVRDVFNVGQPVVYADRKIDLDRYFEEKPAPDFIKVDTDGSDYPVLLGAKHLLSRSVLGVEVEVQLHGAVHEYANTFSNIDTFLRRHGFSLFDLNVYRYSRAELPAPFLYDLAAQTVRGQVCWGDAVYFRDLGHPRYDDTFDYRTSVEDLLKLCCLYVLYGLEDCAAELLLKHEGLAELKDDAELLDSLIPAEFKGEPYERYIQRFNENPQQFFPSQMRSRQLEPKPRKLKKGQQRTVVGGAIGLRDIRVAPHWEGATLEATGDQVTLTTSPVSWAYSAEIRINRKKLPADGQFELAIDVRVDRGEIGIGVLHPNDVEFVVERRCAATPEFEKVVIQLPAIEYVKQIIVRNADGSGLPSIATFRSIELFST